MNILYVYAHPNSSSFNAMIKEHALKLLPTLSTTIKVTDLYNEKFIAVASWSDFDETHLPSSYFLAQQKAYNDNTLVSDITTELKKIEWADHIIFQFPMWWFSTPAILKGWFDRVLVKGFAYDAGKVFNDGLLKSKTASLTVSTQSPESAYQVNGIHNATIDVFLNHIHHTLRFTGIRPLAPFITYGAYDIDDIRKNEIIKNYQTYITNLVENYNELK